MKLNLTPPPSAFEALRRAAKIPDLKAEDPPRRFMKAWSEHWYEMSNIQAELHRQNPPCPCGAMSTKEADEKEHHCYYPVKSMLRSRVVEISRRNSR